MSRRARWVIIHKGRVVLVRGLDARDTLRRYGLKPRWSTAGQGWVIDDRHIPDLAAIADLETAGYRLEHPDGTDCQCGVALRTGRREINVDPSAVQP